MDRHKAISTLNDLIEHCKDGEFNFRKASLHAHAEHIKQVFSRCANDCEAAAEQLQNVVLQLDGDWTDSGTLTGAARRGWVTVKSALTGYKDIDLLEETERGENTALQHYRAALEQELPIDVRAVVEQQYLGAKRNHDEIRELRNQVVQESRE